MKRDRVRVHRENYQKHQIINHYTGRMFDSRNRHTSMTNNFKNCCRMTLTVIYDS